MPYIPPAYNAVVFDDDGVAYTPPAHDAVLFNKNAERLVSRTLVVSTGVITPSSTATSVELAGVSVAVGTGAVGTLVDGGTICYLVGVAVSVVSGELPITWALAGCSVSVAQGGVTPSAHLLGKSVTASKGLLKPGISVRLTGHQLAANSGTLTQTANASATLLSAQVTAVVPNSIASSTDALVSQPLGAVSVGVSRGVPAPEVHQTVALTGISTTVSPGLIG